MKRLFLLLLIASFASATTTVTGNIKNLGTGNSSGFVRFWLRGCAGNQPRVNGTGIIAPSSGGVFYFDFTANASGVVSGTLFSTRDAGGTGNGDIECGGSLTAVWFGMQAWSNGKAGPEIPVHAKNTGTLDISNVTPITTNPVVTSPTGDSTYLRLDTGNEGAGIGGGLFPSGVNSDLGTSSNQWRDGWFSRTLTVASSSQNRLIVNGTNYVSVFSRIQPIQPAPQAPTSFPLGNDLSLETSGPGDLHIKQNKLATTTTAALSIGANNNVLVGSTTNFSTATGMPITLERGKTNEETIIVPNWSIVDGTHMNITCTKTHSGTTDIIQQGSTFLDVADRLLISNYNNPANAGYNVPMRVEDGANFERMLDIPTDSESTFPNNAFQFGQTLTGNPADAHSSGDLLLRNSAAGKAVKMQSSGGATTATFGDSTITFSLASVNVNAAAPALSITDTGASGHQYVFSSGQFATSNLAITDQTASANIANYDPTNGWGFLKKTTFSVGIGNNGSGHKHQRFGATCSTSASVGAQCTSTYSWTSAFADANYTPVCVGVGSTAVPTFEIETVTASGFTVRVSAVTASAASYASVNCTADHD